jgi:hypothetical protein
MIRRFAVFVNTYSKGETMSYPMPILSPLPEPAPEMSEKRLIAARIASRKRWARRRFWLRLRRVLIGQRRTIRREARATDAIWERDKGPVLR